MPGDYPPNGLDRANGLNGQPGTPTNFGARLINGSPLDLSFLEELKDSPIIERGEQGTIVHRFKCDPDTAGQLISTIGRGDIFTDSVGDVTRVLTARYEYQAGDWVLLTITSEGLSFDTPPDEFSVDVVEFNPTLGKHPRYAPLTRQQLQMVYGLQNSQNWLSMVDFSNILSGPALTDDQKNAATELAIKLRKGIDSFYFPGFRVCYSQFYYAPQDINPGGYIEDPVEVGILPPYFWQNPSTGGNTLIEKAQEVSPFMYQNGVQFLRLADTITYQRTWFRRQMSWIMAPAGGQILVNGNTYNWNSHWDKEIYSPDFLPYNLDPNQ